MRVRRTVWAGVATVPKTPKANRSIRLTGMALEALEGQKGVNGRSAWVFPTRNGTPVTCHNPINMSWWPPLDKAGLPRIPFTT